MPSHSVSIQAIETERYEVIDQKTGETLECGVFVHFKLFLFIL